MEKNLGQKIAYVIALLCYLAGGVLAVSAWLYEPEHGNDAVHASLMASVVFSVGCGIVLHVIATTRLKGILSHTSGSGNE